MCKKMQPFILIAAVAVVAAKIAAAAVAVPSTKPHIIMVLQDDLGLHDIGFHNDEMLPVSGNITSLAQNGIILSNHLVHYHCSPTRRSFISGRLPIHHGENLSKIQSDDLDLRWTLVSGKMKQGGYRTHWVGKGHTGYRSMNHLPTRRGFDTFTGFLSGAQSYTSTDRWKQEKPFVNNTYSSILYGEIAVGIVNDHPADEPLFMYLPWQAVHSPYDPVPNWENNSTSFPPYPGTYAGMIYEADLYMGKLVAALKAKNMYDNTLIVYSSDNGGVSENGLAGINYPARGEKHSNWYGGFRVAAFVSGGHIPKEQRGTTSNLRVHVVDWYPTFAALAGVDTSDNALIPPLPVDPSDPTKDIYGNSSYPGIDGVNVWPLLATGARDPNAAHEIITATAQVYINSSYKLLLGQGEYVTDGGMKTPRKDGWRYPNGTWVTAADVGWTCGLAYKPHEMYIPCLFHESDFREEVDLSHQHPGIVEQMWTALNTSLLTAFHSRSPPEMLGPCNDACATEYWKSLGGSGAGPVCGVPGCH